MMLKYLFIAVILIVVSVGLAKDKYVASYLEIEPSARAGAMGNIFSLESNDITQAILNPAGINCTDKLMVQVMHNILFDQLATFNQAGFAISLKNNAIVAVNILRIGIDNIELRDDVTLEQEILLSQGDTNSWAPQNTVNSSQTAIFITFSKKVKYNLDMGWQYFILPLEIPWGINIKLLRAEIATVGGYSGVGVDGGVIFKFDLSDIVEKLKFVKGSVGIAIQNITNTPLKWDNNEVDYIERNLKISIGSSFPINSIKSKVTFGFDFDNLYKEKHYGIELNYNKYVFIRTGFDNTGFGGGVGVKYLKYIIDYSMQYHDLGLIHKISSGYTF